MLQSPKKSEPVGRPRVCENNYLLCPLCFVFALSLSAMLLYKVFEVYGVIAVEKMVRVCDTFWCPGCCGVGGQGYVKQGYIDFPPGCQSCAVFGLELGGKLKC